MKCHSTAHYNLNFQRCENLNPYTEATLVTG